jgi:KaiC/GvpD/RAD55 family RecA-like ATPase
MKWLNRILDQDITDDEKRAEIFRYIIERVEYSVDNPTVPTGIAELDDVLYGGVPKGYAVIITSPSLDEKDLLIENFLLQGVYSDDVVLQICTRMKGCARELVEKNSEGFFLMLCNPWVDNNVRDHPNVINLKGVEDLTQLSISLDVFLREIEEKGESLNRVVINIVSDALLTHETRVVRRWLMDLLTMFKHRNVTSISTLDPEMHSRDEARTIIDLFDGHMEISEKKVNDELRKVLTIKRLYNKKYLERDLYLSRENLTPKKRALT